MQPSQDSYGTPRRPMDVQDYVDVMRRHRSWIVGPAFAGLVIAVVVAFLWPDTYVSDATIRIVPPAVPERLVPTNVNLQVGQRIASFYQDVTSRDNLQNLINTLALYPGKKGRVPLEDIMEEMKSDINMAALTGLREPVDGRATTTAFRVSFSYENKYKAQQVVGKIVSSLVDQTTKTRNDQSTQTSDFLKDKLAAAQKDLNEIEDRVERYKKAFSGKLPTQLDSNLAQLRTLESQLAAATSAISRTQTDKLLIENQISVLKDRLQALTNTPASPLETAAKNARISQLEGDILTSEARLSILRRQLKDTHPDVQSEVARLEGLKQSRQSMLDEEEKKAAAAPQKKTSAVKSRDQSDLEGEIQRYQAMAEAKDKEIEQLAQDQSRITKLQNQYKDRIEAIPGSEREYTELTRDYALKKQQYEDLSMKSSASSMSTELENKAQGELLEVLEQPSLPPTPTEPKRWVIISVGSLLGLVAGFCLAGIREMKDTSLKNLKDVKAYTGLPVLGSVPLVQSDFVVQRRRRMAWLGWSTSCIVGFLLMLGSVYFYYKKGS